MITVKKATIEEAAENAKKMKEAAEKLKEMLKNDNKTEQKL